LKNIGDGVTTRVEIQELYINNLMTYRNFKSQEIIYLFSPRSLSRLTWNFSYVIRFQAENEGNVDAQWKLGIIED
jgi:hypothetical protein